MKSRLTRAEVERIAERIEHRLDWTREGAMPDDFPAMVRALTDHALATTRGKRRKG